LNLQPTYDSYLLLNAYWRTYSVILRHWNWNRMQK